MMVSALAPADRAKAYALGEALHRAAALGDRRWTWFPTIESLVGELMRSLRPECCRSADVRDIAYRLVAAVDYREGGDSMFELALTEILAHGLPWPAEALS
jgi:hypothetical protein